MIIDLAIDRSYYCSNCNYYANDTNFHYDTWEDFMPEMGDVLTFKNSWSSGKLFSWTKSNDMWTDGTFCGNREELIKKGYEESGKKYEIYANMVENFKQLLCIKKILKKMAFIGK